MVSFSTQTTYHASYHLLPKDMTNQNYHQSEIPMWQITIFQERRFEII